MLSYLTMLSISKLNGIDDRMINEYGAVGEMRICRENRNTWRKPTSLELCPPQIPHDLTWD
jgi:hypothetical protein